MGPVHSRYWQMCSTKHSSPAQPHTLFGTTYAQHSLTYSRVTALLNLCVLGVIQVRVVHGYLQISQWILWSSPHFCHQFGYEDAFYCSRECVHSPLKNCGERWGCLIDKHPLHSRTRKLFYISACPQKHTWRWPWTLACSAVKWMQGTRCGEHCYISFLLI